MNYWNRTKAKPIMEGGFEIKTTLVKPPGLQKLWKYSYMGSFYHLYLHGMSYFWL